MTNVDDRTKYLAEQSLKVLEDIRSARIREAQNRQQLYTQTTAGALVFSVSFLTLSGLDDLVSISVLVWSWCLLLLAMVVQLASYVFVDMHFSTHEKYVREWRSNGMDLKNLPKETNTWTLVTRRLNYFGYALTISGIICMVIFAIKNIIK